MKLILTNNSSDSLRDGDIRNALTIAMNETGEFTSSNKELAMFEAVYYSLENDIEEFTVIENGVESIVKQGDTADLDETIINDSLEAVLFNRGGALVPMTHEVNIVIDDTATPLADIEVSNQIFNAIIEGSDTLHFSNKLIAISSVRGILASNETLPDKLTLTEKGKEIIIDEQFVAKDSGSDLYSDLLLEILILRDKKFKENLAK